MTQARPILFDACCVLCVRERLAFYLFWASPLCVSGIRRNDVLVSCPPTVHWFTVLELNPYHTTHN